MIIVNISIFRCNKYGGPCIDIVNAILLSILSRMNVYFYYRCYSQGATLMTLEDTFTLNAVILDTTTFYTQYSNK